MAAVASPAGEVAVESDVGRAARAGDPSAQYELGVRLTHGFGQDADLEAGINWLERAAQQGHLDAQLELARMYDRGLGVPQDASRAALWYRIAAEQGDVGAQLMLADLLFLGRGAEQDYFQAYVWYEIAADYWGGLIDGAKVLVADHLTPDDIDAAERVARDWLQNRRSGVASVGSGQDP